MNIINLISSVKYICIVLISLTVLTGCSFSSKGLKSFRGEIKMNFENKINKLNNEVGPTKVNYEDSISRHYKSIDNYGFKDFIRMDWGFISYFPTAKHWKNVESILRTVPIDSLRYIDSVDIGYTKRHFHVRVYSRNYASESRNTYILRPNEKETNDTLVTNNIYVDYMQSDSILDATTFRKTDFTINYIIKDDVADSIDQRILFDKHFKPKNNAEH